MKQKDSGFTLIEILVVVAIIAFLASVLLVGLNQARIRARDAKRLADMSQLQKAMELYYSNKRGYPTITTAGVPSLTSSEIALLPTAPLPADGSCTSLTNPSGVNANTYYYVPTGTSQVVDGVTVYSSFNYYFCLGRATGDHSAGRKTLTPRGVEAY